MAQYKRLTERQVSFMDGVPVKISEQFKPPRKVGLPAGYEQRLTAETVPEEYDFTLEHSILKKMGEWRKLRNAAEESRNKRIQSSIATKLSDETSPLKCAETLPGTSNNYSESVSPIPSSAPHNSSIPTGSVTHTVTTSVANFNTRNDSILLPVQITQPTTEVQISQISHFNFSDFEADTSSPFDNMELKTINEMEVLAHVLQPLSNSTNASKNRSHFHDSRPTMGTIADVDSNCDAPRHDLARYNLYDMPSVNKDDNLTDNKMMYKCSPNQIAEETLDFYPPHLWPPGDINVGGVNKLIDSQTIPIERLNLNSSTSQSSYAPNRLMHSQSIPIKHFAQANYKSMTNDERYSNQLVGSKFVSLDESREDYTPTFPPSYPGPDKSQSKSVPDIVRELEKELQNKALDRSNEAPARPNSYGSTRLEDWKPWPNLESPQHLRSCLRKPAPGAAPAKSPPRLPNPFNELSPPAQRVATHVSEMGFDLPRVARACQTHGADDKKVVEHLLQIQSLESEDEDFTGDTVERALVANGFDHAKSVAHLKAMKQLLGLGFKEELIYESLVRFENDRDKALDYLIS